MMLDNQGKEDKRGKTLCHVPEDIIIMASLSQYQFSNLVHSKFDLFHFHPSI